MPKLFMMRGLPASGKTTKAKELQEKHTNTLRVSRDDIRLMLDNWSPKKERIVKTMQRVMVYSALEQGYNVIIDDTNLGQQHLNSWKAVAEVCQAKFEMVEMDTSWLECLTRNLERGEKVPQSVITKMMMQYQPEKADFKNILVVDIDGTIANLDHRLKYAKGPEKNWDTFFSLVKDDTLRDDVWEAATESIEIWKNMGGKDIELILVTARPEKCRKDTEEWLLEHTGRCPIMIMREDWDKRDDTETKSDIYEKYLSNFHIMSVVDDRPSVIRMWREKGLSVLDVGEGKEF